MELKCAKCGSKRIVPRARVLDQGEYSDGVLKAALDRNPEAWIFKGTVLSSLCACICADCGFTELYADHPEELYQVYQQTQE
jgi:predicted nucleic-acid-binding Zn-ribbon protein